MIDYAALAKQYGGATLDEAKVEMGPGDAPATDEQFMSKPPVDYAALAKQYGGSTENPEDAQHGIDEKDFDATKKSGKSLARFIPGAIPEVAPKPASPEDKKRAILKDMTGRTWKEKLVGAGETALTAATGAIGAVGGTIGGIAGQIASGELGSPEGTKRAEEVAADAMEKTAYKPRTEKGKEYAAKLADVAQAVPAIIPGAEELAVGARGAPMIGKPFKVGSVLDVSNEGSSKAALAGVGAAEATKSAQREARAANLPIPIQLTKGQKTRDFEQTQFERETAKQPEGEPLRQRLAKQHEDLLRNFGVLEEQTGSEAGDLRETGTVVNRVLVNEKKKAKAEVKAQYDAAKEAGQMAEPVSYASIAKYLDSLPPTVKDKLAPINAAVREELARNDPAGTGMISINAMEDIKQMINKNVTKGTPDQVHGATINDMIKAETEYAGGDLYKKARQTYYDYKQEFDNQGVIRKMLATKPNSNDRVVALEDTMNHIVLLPHGIDELNSVKTLLGKAGAEGKQAWKELQGATIRHIQDEIAKGNAVDINGTKIPSPAAINTLINKLDKQGKLEVLFDKKTAQTLRDLREAAVDALTAPPGSVNFSNTSSALMRVMDKLEHMGKGIPFAEGMTKFMAGKAKSSALKKKVSDALGNAPQVEEVPPVWMGSAK